MTFVRVLLLYICTVQQSLGLFREHLHDLGAAWSLVYSSILNLITIYICVYRKHLVPGHKIFVDLLQRLKSSLVKSTSRRLTA